MFFGYAGPAVSTWRLLVMHFDRWKISSGSHQPVRVSFAVLAKCWLQVSGPIAIYWRRAAQSAPSIEHGERRHQRRFPTKSDPTPFGRETQP